MIFFLKKKKKQMKAPRGMENHPLAMQNKDK
jgi:hypothetical protein